MTTDAAPAPVLEDGAPPRRSPRRELGLAVVLVGGVLLAVVLGTGLGRNPRVVDSVLLDGPAPPLSGATLDGGNFVVAEQVDDGRSDEQIQQWFVDRYGPWILLSPSAGGLGWLAWLLPVVALGAGVLAAARRLGGHDPDIGEDDLRGAEAAARAAAEDALALPLTPAGERVEASLALLESVRKDRAGGVTDGRAEQRALRHVARALAGVGSQPQPRAGAPQRREAGSGLRWATVVGVFGAVLVGLLFVNVSRRDAGELLTGGFAERPAESEPRSAGLDDELSGLRRNVAANPDDARARVVLAVALLQRGAADEAQVEAQAVLAVKPDDADALLILGLAQTALEDPAAAATLRRFLDVAPADQPGRDIAEPILAP
ncbi:MAG: cytochrome c-type biogenesis protein CcmH [Egibacteraceae bacterium]